MELEVFGMPNTERTRSVVQCWSQVAKGVELKGEENPACRLALFRFHFVSKSVVFRPMRPLSLRYIGDAPAPGG